MKVAAVVVTYFPPHDFPSNLVSIVRQVDRVYVVDNGSTSFPFHQVRRLNGVTFIFNEENIGLAAAQNKGVKRALEEGFDWILLLDQDSFLTPGYVTAMMSYFRSLSSVEKKEVFMLGPKIFEEGGDFFYKYLVRRGSYGFRRISCEKASIKNVIFIISAGSMIPRWAFDRLGFFREDFFIDYVDNEFCLRGISEGFRIHVVCKAVLFHRIGVRKLIKIGTLEVKPTFHSPIRRYTIYRNRVWVWKLYYGRVLPFVLFDITASLCDLVRILIFEDKPLIKLRYAIKGLLFGIKTPVKSLRN